MGFKEKWTTAALAEAGKTKISDEMYALLEVLEKEFQALRFRK